MSVSESKSTGRGSRLSPLARPFTINCYSSQRNSIHFNHSLFAAASGSDFGSFTHPNLGGYEHDQPSDVGATSYYAPYPSDTYQPHSVFALPDDSDADSLPLNISSQAGYACNFSGLGSAGLESIVRDVLSYGDQGKRKEGRGTSFSKECDGASSSGDCYSLLKQGEPIVEQSKLFGQTYYESHSTTYRIMGKDNRINLKDMEQINAATALSSSKFSKSEFSCIARQQNSQSGKSITEEALDPLVRVTSLLQITCPKVSDNITLEMHGEEAGVPVEKSSSVFDPNDSDLDSPCWKGTQVRQSYVGAADPVILQQSNNDLEAGSILNPLAYQFLPTTDKQLVGNLGKKPNGDDSSSLHKTSSSVASSSEDHRLVDSTKVGRCPSEGSNIFGIEFAKDLHERGIGYVWPNKSSSGLVLESAVKTSEPVSLHHSDNRSNASNRLNPLAPQFSPVTAKQNGDKDEKQCGGNDFSSLKKSEVSAVSLSSEVYGLIDHVKAQRLPSEGSSRFGTQCSNDVHELGVGYLLPNKSYTSSAIESSSIGQPSLMEDYFTSGDQLALGPSVACSMHGIKDTEHKGSTSVSLPVAENILNSSFPGVENVSDFTEMCRNSFKPAHLKMDVKLLLTTIHGLSELLVQNCSNDLDSMNEHDIVQNIINNLDLYIRSKTQRDPTSDSSDPCVSKSPKKSIDYYKHPLKDLKVTRTNGKAVGHELDGKASCSIVFHDKGLEKGNGVPQVLQENCNTEEEMSPQALLYRSLWLEAEAALCLTKYDASVLHMKNESERCRSDRK